MVVVKRLAWWLLVVCFAGCGGGEKPKTLKNLTFYELTVLRRAEIEELREARKAARKRGTDQGRSTHDLRNHLEA